MNKDTKNVFVQSWACGSTEQKQSYSQRSSEIINYIIYWFGLQFATNTSALFVFW